MNFNFQLHIIIIMRYKSRSVILEQPICVKIINTYYLLGNKGIFPINLWMQVVLIEYIFHNHIIKKPITCINMYNTCPDKDFTDKIFSNILARRLQTVNENLI